MRAPPISAMFPVALLFSMVVLLVVIEPGLASLATLETKANSSLTVVLLAAGQTFPILTGGIDISIGGIVNVVNAVSATQMTDANWPLVAAILLAFGAGAGWLNGFIVVGLGVNPFIGTLATWMVWSGIALVATTVDGGASPAGFTAFVRLGALPVTGSLVILAAVFLGWSWFRRTNTGIALFGIGSNERAAALSGVRTGRIIVLAYVLSGTFAAAAGLYRTVQIGSGSPIAGDALVLPAIAAVVIGGASLAGGRGGVGMSMVGALTLFVIADLLYFVGVSSFFTPLVQGAVLIIAVSITALGERLGELRRTRARVLGTTG